MGRTFWRLSCFITHAKLSQATSQDGLYDQGQAVLRNAASGTAALQSFTQMAWKWHERARNRSLRLLPVMFVTALITVAFNIASIFSSQVWMSTEATCVEFFRLLNVFPTHLEADGLLRIISDVGKTRLTNCFFAWGRFLPLLEARSSYPARTMEL